MLTRKALRRLLFGVVGLVTPLLPAPPVSATPRFETTCTNTNTGSAGCYIHCEKGTDIVIAVVNESSSVAVLGTLKCGSQTASVSSSGLAPPDNFGSRTVRVRKTYTPDDASDPANCFTNNIPGATIRITCSLAKDPDTAAGEGAGTGTVEYLSPGLGLFGPGGAYTLEATFVGAIADPTTLQSFAGPFDVSIAALPFSADTCALGAGNATLALAGAGLSATGQGSYDRVGDVVRIVIDVDNLVINGAPSKPVDFVLTGTVTPSAAGDCVLEPQTAGTFIGSVTIG